MKRLSKTRIQNGRQCHKRLWLDCHTPKFADWSSSSQSRLHEGRDFGILAQSLLGGGYVIEADHFHLPDALVDTAQQLALPVAQAPMLFEPAFQYRNVSVRVDAFSRSTRGDHLIEVKSVTTAKEVHAWDCAIQTWVARGTGCNVTKVSVAHLNREFVLKQPGDYDGLLACTDITDQVEALLPKLEALVCELQAVANGKEPRIRTGPHCFAPYDCPYLAHCRAQEPPGPDFPIEQLPNAGKLIDRLREAGIKDIRNIPEPMVAQERHLRIIRATHSGKPYVSSALATTLQAIPYPRYFLDFETIQFAVPRWVGTRPFQQIPFQFSCHVDAGDGQLGHTDYLDLTGADPSRRFAEALIDAVDTRGSVIVWNRGFESGRIRELATRFPDLAKALTRIIERMVDLLPMYREGYYHPDMQGSWSLKSVLPTIAPDLDYNALCVGDGMAAQDAYRQAIAPKTSAEERFQLQANLREYCRPDTFAMVRLIAGPGKVAQQRFKALPKQTNQTHQQEPCP